jgi:hypothetical protein
MMYLRRWSGRNRSKEQRGGTVRSSDLGRVRYHVDLGSSFGVRSFHCARNQRPRPTSIRKAHEPYAAA